MSRRTRSRNVRRIRHNGEMKWKGRLMCASQSLTGEPIGLDQLDDTRWRVHYGMLPLGTLDLRAARPADRGLKPAP